jgi:hypothetical protein
VPWGATLSQLRDLSLLLTIYTFFAGWNYQYFYLTWFGVSPNTVDIPFHTTLAFAANVFAQPFAIRDKLLAVAGFGMIALLSYWKNRWRFCLLIVALAALFPAIQWVAYRTASEIAHDLLESGQLHRIQFAFREDFGTGKVSVELTAHNASGLCLIVEAKDRFWVLPCRSEGGARQVYEIKSTDVLAAQVVPRK